MAKRILEGKLLISNTVRGKLYANYLYFEGPRNSLPKLMYISDDVEYISVSGCTVNFIRNMPENLKVLELKSCNSPKLCIEKLPKNIEELRIYKNYYDGLNPVKIFRFDGFAVPNITVHMFNCAQFADGCEIGWNAYVCRNIMASFQKGTLSFCFIEYMRSHSKTIEIRMAKICNLLAAILSKFTGFRFEDAYGIFAELFGQRYGDPITFNNSGKFMAKDNRLNYCIALSKGCWKNFVDYGDGSLL